MAKVKKYHQRDHDSFLKLFWYDVRAYTRSAMCLYRAVGSVWLYFVVPGDQDSHYTLNDHHA